MPPSFLLWFRDYSQQLVVLKFGELCKLVTIESLLAIDLQPIMRYTAKTLQRGKILHKLATMIATGCKRIFHGLKIDDCQR